MRRRTRRWIIGLIIAAVVVGVAAAVIVSLRGSVDVPDVAGKTQTEAAQALEAAGLEVGAVAEASDPEAPAGAVIRQDPAAGTEVDKGSAVDLTLSSGPGMAEVPDVVGMDQAEAESALADAGFVPASAMQYDLSAPAGEVVEQLPAGGEQAVAGSQVGLLVSKGRPEVSVSVPDVTGMTQDDATTALADAGLVAVPVEAYVADVPKGEVAEQEPAAGDRVAPLSEVLVTVSLGEGKTSVVVPDVVGQKQAKATTGLEAAGLVVTAAEAWSPDVAEGVVIAQAPKAGVKVEEGGDAGILVSLGPLPSPSPTPAPSESGAAPPSPRRPRRPPPLRPPKRGSAGRAAGIDGDGPRCRRDGCRRGRGGAHQARSATQSCSRRRARPRRQAVCPRSCRRPASRSRRPIRCCCSSRPGRSRRSARCRPEDEDGGTRRNGQSWRVSPRGGRAAVIATEPRRKDSGSSMSELQDVRQPEKASGQHQARRPAGDGDVRARRRHVAHERVDLRGGRTTSAPRSAACSRRSRSRRWSRPRSSSSAARSAT